MAEKELSQYPAIGQIGSSTSLAVIEGGRNAKAPSDVLGDFVIGQIDASGIPAEVEALKAGQQTSAIYFSTKAELDAVTGTSNQGAFVTTGLGAGQYRWTGSAWEFLRADLLTQKEDKSTSQIHWSREPGLSEIFESPNQYVDSKFDHMVAAATGGGFTPADGSGTYLRGSGAALAHAVAADGRPAFSFEVSNSASAYCRWSKSIYSVGVSPGQLFSASVRIVAASIVGVARVLLQQFDAAGAEIAEARRSASFSTGTLGENLVEFSSTVVHVSAKSVGIYVDANSLGTQIRLTDYLLAVGAVAGYRPPIEGYVLSESQTESIAKDAVLASMSDASENPNLVAPGSFDFTGLGPLASGGAAATTYGGKPCWKITDPSPGNPEEAVAIGRFPAGQFRGRVSAGVFIAAVEAGAAGSGARVLLRQFNENAEITAVRQTQQLGTGGSAVGETQVSFNNVAVDPSATSVELYIAVLSGNAGTRSLYFRSPVVRPGGSAAWVSPSASVGAPSAQVHVAPTGSDSNAGSASAPLATIPAALNLIRGDGAIYVHPGVYGQAQSFDPRSVTGSVKIIGVRGGLSGGNYAWPTVILGSRVTGVSKTPGRSKVYQAAVAGLPTLAAFQWAYQHGVADPATLIDPQDRFPQHQGRTNRLQDCAKLVKTTSTVLADALAEIDASATPKAFIDAGVLYFSVVGGGDAAGADIYLDAATGMVAGGTRGGAGHLSISGLNVMYGGLDLTPFSRAEVDEVRVVGARINALDYNVLSYGALEVCCAGSQSQYVGDGLSGHFGALVVGLGDLYSHDNWDDGFSDHEGCTSRLTGGGLVEYNGGAGLAPAYGSDAVARGFISVRNQQRGTHKAGAFYVTGLPSAGTPPESGADTNGLFVGCTDYESLTSFADDYTISGGSEPVVALCVGCRSIRPVTRGFNVRKIVDCGYVAGASSSARNASTLVENTAPVV